MAEYGRYIDFDTIRREKNENQNERSTGSSTAGTGGSSTARARTRTREEFVRVLQYAAEALQLRPGPVLQRDVYDALADGMEADTLIACIQEAEVAPRPSWGYARAVIRRCRQSRILTMDDWEKDRNRWGNRKNPAGNFDQRDYTEEDMRKIYVQFDMEDDE